MSMLNFLNLTYNYLNNIYNFTNLKTGTELAFTGLSLMTEVIFKFNGYENNVDNRYS